MPLSSKPSLNGRPPTGFTAPSGDLAHRLAGKLISRPSTPAADGADPVPAFARQSDLIGVIRKDLAAIGIVGEADTSLLAYLAFTSRILSDPLAIVTRGQSAAGKTTILNRVATLFPPEVKIDAMQLTPASLFNTSHDYFEHKILISGERKHSTNDATRDANAVLRQLLSEKRITRMVSVFEPETKGYVTANVVRRGPLAYAESTTAGTIFEEDLNRMLQVYVDDSAAQTRAVMRSVAGRYDPARGDVDVEAVVERHHAFQRALVPKDVRIPFWEALADGIPADRVEARRVIGQVLAVVEAVAVLHQFRRDPEPDGYILATLNDYALARRLLLSPVHAAVGAGTEYKNAERLRQRLGKATTFTARGVQDAMGYKSPMGASHLLDGLVKAGLVVQVTAAAGRTAALYRWPNDLDSMVLPTVESLRAAGAVNE